MCPVGQWCCSRQCKSNTRVERAFLLNDLVFSSLLRVMLNLEAEASHVGALKRDIERLVPYVNAGGFRAKCAAVLDLMLIVVLL